ncbi:2-octaprenyl-3-methyl-6-methoxy-1,4-benzoquinol hydroxylase [Pseudoalteromonas luteoviolacea B = ATCC 29581]|nr:2-octaprenyl-3-methyl-6-methoxy-1,4-benzoquinol hydroxylase [Pseudoalteromonas luteoviolacea B = ATCC 29581]
MQQVQVCIVGGGCVGLAAALGLAKQGIRVAVVDRGGEPQPLGEQYETRVSAISLASQQLFDRLGVWEKIKSLRAAPYHFMDVRDQDSEGKIAFNAADLELSELGHIIENEAIRLALYDALSKHPDATMLFNTQYTAVHQTDTDVLVTLDSGMPLMAKLLIAADGANSGLRKQFNMPITFWDYDHHAIVATVKTQQIHAQTARQVFLPTGPLAFLPLHDAHSHSIVWSTSPEHAKTLMAMDDSTFSKAIHQAIDGQCGLCEVQSERAVLPLTMRYAKQWVNGKVVLMGDAAHTIHPLAGLGMNLGLKDAALLIELLSQSNDTFANTKTLREYERRRKLDAQKHIAMMQGLKTLFEGNNPLKKLIRGVGLSMVDKLGPIKDLFAKQAIEGK